MLHFVAVSATIALVHFGFLAQLKRDPTALDGLQTASRGLRIIFAMIYGFFLAAMLFLVGLVI